MSSINNLCITDPVYLKKPRLNFLERWGSKLINDIRDLPFIKLCLFYCLTVIPAALYLYLTPQFHWAIGLLYLAILYAFLVGPYVLMLHNISHRKLFKKKYERLNYFIVWFLGPFFGETPETYYVHHIGMHHTEGNLPQDLSSTMKYERDNFFHFLRYVFRFFSLAGFELGYYLKKNKRKRLLKRMVAGELTWWAAIIFLAYLNFSATLVVFILPVLITRFMMMNGNWAQHAFINPKAPECSYQNSITCINSRYNRTCFNDGYHIGHHVSPSRHWTEMPEDFVNDRTNYQSKNSVVFEKIDYLAIWLFLMLKRYDWLAKYFVDLDSESPRSREEIMFFLKSRTRPITSK